MHGNTKVTRKNLAVFASGAGTTLQAIITACKASTINANVNLLVSDKPECGAVHIAHSNSIEVQILDAKTRNTLEKSLRNLKIDERTDLIVLAGFNRILPASFVSRFENKMINTHPALLPCFGGQGMYGMKVHRAVLQSGARVSGCSVHFVSIEVDGGPIISQKSVPVLDTDSPETLAERVKATEKEVLIESIHNLLERKFVIQNKRVIFQD